VAATVHGQTSYEQLLVPVSVADLAGANGSVWTTELWAVNTGQGAARITPLPCTLELATCSEDFVIPPDQSVRVQALGTPDNPGVILAFPRTLAPAVSFTLHVRDLSRQSESWGAELPVVRTTDFLTQSVSLTSIPAGPEYRQTLRLYATPETTGVVELRLRLYNVTGTADVLLRETVAKLSGRSNPLPTQIGSPLSQTTVTEIFAGGLSGAERLRLTIEPIASPSGVVSPYWALVSVTNNATQQVTTVTPH
jgi:hypothetical protein